MGMGPLSLCPESFVDMLVVLKVRLSTPRAQQDAAEIQLRMVRGWILDF